MLRILYAVIIAPLELVMRSVLSWGYDITASYGLAIVILSLVVNTAILPIYNKAESWQEEERAIKKKMERTERMIEKNFSGQEKFAMLSTLRRQHGYSTRLALRSSVGFFLQIPFFFAAYHLLSNFEGIRGVALGPIADLGSPDVLLRFGGLEIHLLPIIMTVVNLASAFIYTSSLTRKDKIQLYGLAGLFLVLLYQSPAALTLYWTLNNIYSLGKNFYAKSISPRLTSRWLDNIAQKLASIPGACWLYLILFVLSLIGSVWVSVYVWGQKITPWNLSKGTLRGAITLILFTILFLYVALTKKKCLQGRLQAVRLRHFATCVMLLAGISWIGVFAFDIQAWYASIRNPNFGVFGLLGSLLLMLMTATVITIIESIKIPKLLYSASNLWAYVTALAMLVCVVVPFTIFSGDPLAMGVTWMRMVPFAVLACILGLAGFACLIWLFPKDSYYFIRKLIVVAFYVATVFGFLFVGNYGLLVDGVTLSEPEGLYQSINYVYDFVIVAVITIALFFVAKKKWIENIGKVALLSTVVIAGYSLTSTVVVVPTKQSIEKPRYTDSLYTLSQNHQNLILVIMDMFTADHFPVLLRENPRIAEAFDGFTWYRDTVATGSGTAASLASTVGGRRFTIHRINEKNQGQTFQEWYGKSYELTPTLLGDKWESQIAGSLWQPQNPLPNLVNIPNLTLQRDWLGYYEASKELVAPVAQMGYSRLLSLSLFKVSPYSLRQKVYRNGDWLIAGRNATDSFRAIAPLKAWRHETKVAITQKSQYRHFYFEGTHSGFYFNEKNEPLIAEPTIPLGWLNEHPDFGYTHYVAEKTHLYYFAQYLKKLKEMGIYNQTRIVLVSDHGGWDTHTLREAIGGFPHRGRLTGMLKNPGIAYPLLLVKDFHATGPLQISDHPMRNANSFDVLLKDLVVIPREYRADYQNPNRIRHYHSTEDFQLNKGHIQSLHYEIKGTMFDRKNWYLLSQDK